MPTNPAAIWVSNSVVGHGAAGQVEHLEVLVGRRAARRRPGPSRISAKRRDVDGQRVDQGQAVAPGELHQRELREVGALAVELGVDRVGRLGRAARRGPSSKPASVSTSWWLTERRQPGSPPVTTGRPELDPGQGAAGHVGGVDALGDEPLGGPHAAGAAAADHVDGPVGRDLVDPLGHLAQRDEHGARHVGLARTRRAGARRRSVRRRRAARRAPRRRSRERSRILSSPRTPGAAHGRARRSRAGRA